jgi:hypothetical protein
MREIETFISANDETIPVNASLQIRKASITCSKPLWESVTLGPDAGVESEVLIGDTPSVESVRADQLPLHVDVSRTSRFRDRRTRENELVFEELPHAHDHVARLAGRILQLVTLVADDEGIIPADPIGDVLPVLEPAGTP